MLTLVGAVFAVAAVTVSPRLAARSALLDALPPNQPPKLLCATTIVLINRLEASGSPPSTAEFLSFGLQGRWSLLATVRDAARLEPGFSPATANAVPGSRSTNGLPPFPVPMGIARAEVAVLPNELLVRSAAWFQLVDASGQQLGAKLEVDSRFAFELDAMQGRAVMDLSSCGNTRLMLPTSRPGCSIDTLMEALHARLSPDFSLEDGEEGQQFKLRLQTTYLDEMFWVTRSAPFCCTVYRRADDQSEAAGL